MEVQITNEQQKEVFFSERNRDTGARDRRQRVALVPFGFLVSIVSL